MKDVEKISSALRLTDSELWLVEKYLRPFVLDAAAANVCSTSMACNHNQKA